MSTAVSSLDIETVHELVRPMRPAASVYLAASSPSSRDACDDLALRWQRISHQLAVRGADRDTVDALGQWIVMNLPSQPVEAAMFASAGELRFAQLLPGGVPRGVTRYGAPPTVTPLLAWAQRHPAYVLVVLDPEVADVTAVPAGALEGTTRTVNRPEDGIVAEELQRVCGDLLLVAGDAQGAHLLADRLRRAGHKPTILDLPGVRRRGACAHEKQAAVADALDAYAEQRTAVLRARLIAADESFGAGVQGVGATLAALSAGRVRVLLVVDDPADERPAWFGPDVWCTATAFDAGRQQHPTRRGRLIDVAVRAALLGGAQVRILRPAEGIGLVDGVAALCRHR